MSAPVQPLPNHLTYAQVEEVIRAFYQRLLAHPQLGGYFAGIEDFTSHEKRIADFWWLALGGRLPQPPKIDMINKHMSLGISGDDLRIWLSILSSTLEQKLTIDQAKHWQSKAQQIGARLEHIVIQKQAGGISISEAKKPSRC
jgi:hemoglobin